MNTLIKSLFTMVLSILLLVSFVLPVAASEKGKAVPDVNKFCGVWKYESKNKGTGYLKVTREGDKKFIFNDGYESEGNIVWTKPILEKTKAIYLKPSKGKLTGKFVSANFYATHGMDFTYKITLELKSDNKMIYSVWSDINGDTDKSEAVKVSN